MAQGSPRRHVFAPLDAATANPDTDKPFAFQAGTPSPKAANASIPSPARRGPHLRRRGRRISVTGSPGGGGGTSAFSFPAKAADEQCTPLFSAQASRPPRSPLHKPHVEVTDANPDAAMHPAPLQPATSSGSMHVPSKTVPSFGFAAQSNSTNARNAATASMPFVSRPSIFGAAVACPQKERTAQMQTGVCMPLQPTQAEPPTAPAGVTSNNPFRTPVFQAGSGGAASKDTEMQDAWSSARGGTFGSPQQSTTARRPLGAVSRHGRRTPLRGLRGPAHAFGGSMASGNSFHARAGATVLFGDELAPRPGVQPAEISGRTREAATGFSDAPAPSMKPVCSTAQSHPRFRAVRCLVASLAESHGCEFVGMKWHRCLQVALALEPPACLLVLCVQIPLSNGLAR
jgi:hypothetical protein